MTNAIKAFSLALLMAVAAPATVVRAESDDNAAFLFVTGGPASEALDVSFTLVASPGVECAVSFTLVIAPENGRTERTYEVALSNTNPSAAVTYAFARAAPPHGRVKARGLISKGRSWIKGIGRCSVLTSAEKFSLRTGESRGTVKGGSSEAVAEYFFFF